MSKSPLDIMKMLNSLANGSIDQSDLPPDVRQALARAKASGNINAVAVNMDQLEEISGGDPLVANMLRLSSLGVVDGRESSHLASRYALQIKKVAMSSTEEFVMSLGLKGSSPQEQIRNMSEDQLGKFISCLTDINSLLEELSEGEPEKEKLVIMNVMAALTSLGFDNVIQALRQGFPRLLWAGFQHGALDMLKAYVDMIIERVGEEIPDKDMFERVASSLLSEIPLCGPELTPYEKFATELDSEFVLHHAGSEAVNKLSAAGYKTLPDVFAAGDPTVVLVNAGFSSEEGAAFVSAVGDMQMASGESEFEFRKMMREVASKPSVLSFIMNKSGVDKTEAARDAEALLSKIGVSINDLLSWLQAGHDNVVSELAKRIPDPVELVNFTNRLMLVVKSMTEELSKSTHERSKKFGSKPTNFADGIAVGRASDPDNLVSQILERLPESEREAARPAVKAKIMSVINKEMKARRATGNTDDINNEEVLLSDPVVRTAIGPAIAKLAEQYNITDFHALVKGRGDTNNSLKFSEQLSRIDRGIIGDIVRFKLTLASDTDNCDCKNCVENRQFRVEYLQEHPDVAMALGLEVDDNPYGKTLH